MRKKNGKKLNLSRETLSVLDKKSLEDIGAAAVGCQESRMICSVRHTCVSCKPTDDTCA